MGERGAKPLWGESDQEIPVLKVKDVGMWL